MSASRIKSKRTISKKFLQEESRWKTSVAYSCLYTRVSNFNCYLSILRTCTTIVHRRTGRGGTRGATAPPKFGQLRFFWAASENLGKATFWRRFHVFYYYYYFEEIIFSILTRSQRNNSVTFTRDMSWPNTWWVSGYKGRVSYADFFYCWALYFTALAGMGYSSRELIRINFCITF